MKRKNFKEIHASSGPDQPKSPPKSRAQRLAEVTPPIRVELLEARRMFDSAQIVSGVLVVTGDSTADSIEVYEEGGYVKVDFEQAFYDSFVPGNIYAGYVKVDALGGNDTILIWGAGTGYELRFPALVYGGDGTDSIDGGTSGYPDSLYGGAGNDTIHGHADSDLLYGDDGNDNLSGEADADTVYGGVGYDTVYGGTENDRVYGGTGSGVASDSITGYDLLYGGDGNDIMYGEGGFDTIYGDAGADGMKGGDGNDYLHGGLGADGMHGQEGDDTLNATDDEAVTDLLDGGNGTDCGYWTEGEDDDIDMEGNFN